MAVTVVPSLRCLEVIEYRKESQIVNEMKRQKSRQGGWLFWRPYVRYRKIKYILKLIVLNWGKAGQTQMTWGNSVTSFDLPMASFKSEVHVRGQRTHSPAPSTHLILMASSPMTSGFHVILPPSAALPNSRGNITSQIEQINMNFVRKILSHPLTYLKMSQIWLL